MGEKEYRTILGENETRLPADISKKKSRFFLFAVFFAGALLSLFIYTLTTVPADFTPGTYVEIPEGYTLQSIGKLLKERSIIRSSVMFNLLVLKEGKEKNIPAGTYLFKDRDAVFTVAMRMANGEHGIEVHKITLPEGMTRKEMADILVRELPQFDSELFRNETAGEEGYLFPDTYFFYSNATSGAVKEALVDNFVKKTGRLKSESLLNESDWKNIIVMASLIEGEAATPLDRRIISGILWNRIKRGMRLQVDAPFVYIYGKGSSELTASDLASDTPYNTYRYLGLPPYPIGNPGLDSIDAALHPATTTYMYYLSDKNGAMHYAKTFEDHKLNKAKYLR